MANKSLTEILNRFDEKFVNKTIRQVDTGNSIELPLWKNPHSHQTQDVKDFLVESIKDALEAVRVPEREHCRELYCTACKDNKMFNQATTQYDENVRKYLGEEKV